MKDRFEDKDNVNRMEQSILWLRIDFVKAIPFTKKLIRWVLKRGKYEKA